VNLSRLMALGVLAERGPAHGHQIRRHAEITNVEAWGGVSVGSLYRELRHMTEAGLVEPVREERLGRRPARTIYQITETGRRELAALREQAILEVQTGPDGVGVALLFGGFADPADLATLGDLVTRRRDAVAATLEAVAAERRQLLARGDIGDLAAAVFRRKEASLSAELAWYEEFTATLARLRPAVHDT